MADIFSAIADATRRELLQVLLERQGEVDDTGREYTAGELAERVDLTSQTVARHLSALRDVGLVSVREDGNTRLYSLTAAPLEQLEDWLVPFIVALEHEAAYGMDADSSAVFAAWSGADVGESIGRSIAERSHKARVVIHDASDQVAKRLPKTFMRRKFTQP